MFINITLKELQSNYSCFTAHQMLFVAGSLLPEDGVNNEHRIA